MLRKHWALRLNNSTYDHELLFYEVLSKIPLLGNILMKLEKRLGEIDLSEIYFIFKVEVSESFVMSIIPNSDIIYDISEERLLNNAFKFIMYQNGDDYEYTN